MQNVKNKHGSLQRQKQCLYLVTRRAKQGLLLIPCAKRVRLDLGNSEAKFSLQNCDKSFAIFGVGRNADRKALLSTSCYMCNYIGILRTWYFTAAKFSKWWACVVYAVGYLSMCHSVHIKLRSFKQYIQMHSMRTILCYMVMIKLKVYQLCFSWLGLTTPRSSHRVVGTRCQVYHMGLFSSAGCASG